MRTAAVMVLVLAACGGGDDGVTARDSGLGDGRPFVVPPDADLSITGTWLDKYFSLTSSPTVPSCTIGPTAIVIDQVTGAIQTYHGACKSDGTFRIATTESLGTYYLKIGSAWLETDKQSGIDLSTDHLGRADIGAIASASLSIDMTNLASWNTADALFAFAPNVGYSQQLNFSPAASATTVQGTAAWAGPKVDATKNDTVQIVQLGTHQTISGLAYQTLDRTFDAPAFTMANNTTSAVSGAFTTATMKSQQVRVNAASFNAFTATVNPNVSGRTIEGTMYAAPSTEVLRSPSLFAFSVNGAGQTSLNFGTMSIVDPYPATWQRLVRIQEAYTVPYTLNNVNGALNAVASRIVSAATVNTTIVDAQLGPPTSPKLDTDDAFTATHISPVAKVSWSAPSLGTPTDYEIQIYDVTISGTALKFTSVFRLTTKLTETRIPAGTLLGGRQYIFSIRSRIRENVDIYTKPVRSGDTSSSAEILSAIVTIDT